MSRRVVDDVSVVGCTFGEERWASLELVENCTQTSRICVVGMGFMSGVVDNNQTCQSNVTGLILGEQM